ncbi:MAG TPA: 50S ribosomal protein L15 [Candidatus Levybacteria bacterium]|nr:50S ribosomal protein L15 [Candidatus Levybacteria bacterium]
MPRLKDTSSKRLGRGHGSGRGKTSGRGTKGQKARRDISLSFEGGALPLIKRMPFLRGKGRNRVFALQPVEVTLHQLNTLPAKSVVTVELLVKNNVIKAGTKKVKVLATGTLDTALTVKVPVTKGAQTVIEKAGGTVEL